MRFDHHLDQVRQDIEKTDRKKRERTRLPIIGACAATFVGTDFTKEHITRDRPVPASRESPPPHVTATKRDKNVRIFEDQKGGVAKAVVLGANCFEVRFQKRCLGMALARMGAGTAGPPTTTPTQTRPTDPTHPNRKAAPKPWVIGGHVAVWED